MLSVSEAGYRATSTRGALQAKPTFSGMLRCSFRPDDYVFCPANPSMHPSAEPANYLCAKVMLLVPEVRDASRTLEQIRSHLHSNLAHIAPAGHTPPDHEANAVPWRLRRGRPRRFWRLGCGPHAPVQSTFEHSINKC